MSVHHQIWKLVKMIGSPSAEELPQTSKASSKAAVELPPDETVYGRTGPEVTVAHGARTLREAEISRLTWVVLDGNSSVADRQRLAELVSAQHASRRA